MGIPSGFYQERRFKSSAFAMEETGFHAKIKYSTGAHPLSPAYPYEAVPPSPRADSELQQIQQVQRGSVGQSSSGASGGHAEAHAGDLDDSVGSGNKPAYMAPLKDPSEEANRRNPIRTADLNYQYFKYRKRPKWGFG